MYIKNETREGISDADLTAAIENSVLCDESRKLKKVLLIPPDFTRMYSGAGKITDIYYRFLTKNGCDVSVIPALGTHEPMSAGEIKDFFISVPEEKVIRHNWRTDVVKIGEIPAEFVSEVSDDLVNEKIDVEVNKLIVSGEFDLIISIGQVVPHEVAGMANYSKNIFVGCGGSSMISSSHMLGAFYGMERIMGRDYSPVRKVFDYAEEHFLGNVPLMYVLTVTTNEGDRTNIHGLYIGRERKLFSLAVEQSQKINLTHMKKPIKKAVVYLDEREFKSTWLGNKAIYRTRMAIEDGGELIVLAPGVRKFGEDDGNDVLIRKYGYVGRERVLELVSENDDLKENLSVAAHLIHGSSDGRFGITYATDPGKLTEHEITGANFKYMPYSEAVRKYNPAVLKDGYNELEDGEVVFYISNPALGLWIWDKE